MSPGTKLHIFAPQSCNLAVAETSLNGDQQKRSVPPSNPSCWIRSCQQCSRLFFGKKPYRAALIALCWNRQHTLALQSQWRFTDRYVLKKCMYRSEAVVSCPRLIAAGHFEMIEKLFQQTDIEIFNSYFRGASFQALRGESK
jgi:hypothetical protein